MGKAPVMIRVCALVAMSALSLAPAGASASASCPPFSPNNRLLASARAESAIAVGCPLQEVGGRPLVSIRVRKWCNLPGPHNQVLFKLKVSIHNASSQTFAIDISHWRLLVSDFKQGRWRPPPSSYPTGRPTVVRWAGRAWWAIPANPNGAAEPDPYSPGLLTFATHWTGRILPPGGNYFRPGFHEGDLVFYVPDNDPAHPHTELSGDVALAYFAGRTPTAVAPFSQWGPRADAASF